MKYYFFPFLIMCVYSLSSCSGHLIEDEHIKSDMSLVFINDQKMWTYFSLEKGQKVGQSLFGDSIQDREWSQRLDWDIAVSGDLIRTNSGDSGIGKGGILEMDKVGSETDFPLDGYEKDHYE